MSAANISLEIFGMTISVILLICGCIEVPVSGKQTGMFIAMLLVNIAVLGCDMITWIIEGEQYTILLYILNFFVYSLGYVLTALFTFYLVTYIAQKESISKSIAPIICIFCFAAIILVIVSMFNHMYFKFDNGVYIRGPMYWLSQVCSIVIIITDMIIVINHRKVLGIHDIFSLLSYGILPVIAMIIQIKIYGITLLYIATTLSLLIIYITIHIEQNRRIEQQKADLAQANIAIMLSQIQPHFLYNSLTSISRLCDINPKKAKEATVEFSKYLRGNIDSLKQKSPVSFETELKHIEIYLYLEKMRFQDNLKVIYDIQTTAFYVPSLTIQPLVENAVKYGVCQKEDGGTVKISTYEGHDSFIVKITDDGVGFDPSETKYDGRTHIGIDNVRSRLYAICHASMRIDSVKGSGTTVTVTIPKEI